MLEDREGFIKLNEDDGGRGSNFHYHRPTENGIYKYFPCFSLHFAQNFQSYPLFLGQRVRDVVLWLVLKLKTTNPLRQT